MRALSILLAILLTSIFTGCQQRQEAFATLELTGLEGQKASFSTSHNRLTVVYFLSPECPLCINYSKEIIALDTQFANDSILFLGVFPGEWYSASEVRGFGIKYGVEIPFYFDPKNELVHALMATITPEVFVLGQNGKVVYSGKIDNWVNALGKKKLEISDPYLENAIVAALNGEPVTLSRTEPIGCLIE